MFSVVHEHRTFFYSFFDNLYYPRYIERHFKQEIENTFN